MKSLIISPIVVVSLVVVAGVVQVQGALPVEKICGELHCPEHHACSPTDHQCIPCVRICSNSTSNYDHRRCEEGCQDYLHDKLYVRNTLKFATKDDIESLKTILIILLVITIPTFLLVLLLASGVLRAFIQQRGKINEKKKSIALDIIYDNKFGQEKVTLEDLNKIKRGSIKLAREPSESTLPDVADYSYDNPTMSHSPVHPAIKTV